MSHDQKANAPQNKVTFNQQLSSEVLGDRLNQLSSEIQAFKNDGQKEHQINADEKPTMCFGFFKSLTSSIPKKAISKYSEKTPLTPASESKGF
jgi:hypothetical protein